MAVFEREVLRVQTARNSLARLLIDLDHFKQFNDLHGHSSGDQLLHAFGTLLQGFVRGSNLACRYGGEEFAVMLPKCSPESARRRAEEICSETE